MKTMKTTTRLKKVKVINMNNNQNNNGEVSKEEMMRTLMMMLGMSDAKPTRPSLNKQIQDAMDKAKTRYAPAPAETDAISLKIVAELEQIYPDFVANVIDNELLTEVTMFVIAQGPQLKGRVLLYADPDNVATDMASGKLNNIYDLCKRVPARLAGLCDAIGVYEMYTAIVATYTSSKLKEQDGPTDLFVLKNFEAFVDKLIVRLNTDVPLRQRPFAIKAYEHYLALITRSLDMEDKLIPDFIYESVWSLIENFAQVAADYVLSTTVLDSVMYSYAALLGVIDVIDESKHNDEVNLFDAFIVEIFQELVACAIAPARESLSVVQASAALTVGGLDEPVVHIRRLMSALAQEMLADLHVNQSNPHNDVPATLVLDRFRNLLSVKFIAKVCEPAKIDFVAQALIEESPAIVASMWVGPKAMGKLTDVLGNGLQLVVDPYDTRVFDTHGALCTLLEETLQSAAEQAYSYDTSVTELTNDWLNGHAESIQKSMLQCAYEINTMYDAYTTSELLDSIKEVAEIINIEKMLEGRTTAQTKRESMHHDIANDAAAPKI